MVSENFINQFRQHGVIFRQGGKLVVNSDDMTTDQKHCYCNSLLYNLFDRDIDILQRVQNCLARVVCEASRFSRSKPLLNFLHWLPVKYRFKLCTITFKAFLFHQPTYLFNYLVPLQNSRLLRSSNTNMLTVPRLRTKWGSRAFAVAAPSTWNSLPVNLRTASTVTSFTPPPPNSSEIRRPVDDLITL